MPNPRHILVCFLFGVGSIAGQQVEESSATSARAWIGHWAGAIHGGGGPGKPLPIEFDFFLDPADPSRVARGEISIPSQSIDSLELIEFTVEADRVRCRIPHIAGEPRFDGRLEGDTIAGAYKQSGIDFTFRVDRADSPADDARAALSGFGEFAERTRQARGVPGAAVAVVSNGEVVFAEGFGHRELETLAPVDADTLFAIGSTTKAFTTALIATYVEDGTLDWDRPVRRYVPEFRLQDDTATELMTLRDLVTHRSGVPRHELLWYGNGSASRAEILSRLAHVEPTATFRERFQYSNLMYIVAGHVVERVADTTWEAAMRERILDPLGMRRTRVSEFDAQQDDNHARPYRPDEVGKLVQVPFQDHRVLGPAGTLSSSVQEMCQWLLCNLGEGELNGSRILKSSSLRAIQSPQIVVPDNGDGKTVIGGAYGFGWMLDHYRGHRRVHHGGALNRFVTYIALFPDDDVGVVAFANMASDLSLVLCRDAADRVLGLERTDWSNDHLAQPDDAHPPTPSVDNRVSDTVLTLPLADYAGEFTHPAYGTIAVSLASSGLRLAYRKHTAELEHWHFDVFRLESSKPGEALLDDQRLQFLLDIDGIVNRLEIALEPTVAPITFRRRPSDALSDPATLVRLVGRYALSGSEDLVGIVTVDAGVLSVILPGQPRYILEPSVAGRYQLVGMNGYTVEFELGESGPASKCTFYQPDGVYVSTRLKDE